jgi:hypothetical protein
MDGGGRATQDAKAEGWGEGFKTAGGTERLCSDSCGPCSSRHGLNEFCLFYVTA